MSVVVSALEENKAEARAGAVVGFSLGSHIQHLLASQLPQRGSFVFHPAF